MNDTEIQILKSAIADEFSKRDEQLGCKCTAAHCMEHCGITPVNHAKDHKFIWDLRSAFSDAGKTIRQTLVKWVVIAIICLVLTGIALNISGVDKWLQKVID